VCASIFATACGPANGAGGEDVGSAQQAQVPFDLGNPDFAQEIDLLINGSSFVRVVVTADDPLLGGSSYDSEMEYWYTKEAPADMPPSMSMGFSYDQYSPTQLDAFRAGYSPAFRVGEMGAVWSQWTAESQPNMQGLRTYLYQAPDPDNPDNADIGLAVGIGANNLLQQIVWFKSQPPVNGFLWQPEKSPPTGLTWTFVGATLDPFHINPESDTWYFIQQGS
jgi:hypothetical protein